MTTRSPPSPTNIPPPSADETPSLSLETLQATHRAQQRALQHTITQKKKAATKKTRKHVNDECAALLTSLTTRQALETEQFFSQPSEAGSNTRSETPSAARRDVRQPADQSPGHDTAGREESRAAAPAPGSAAGAGAGARERKPGDSEGQPNADHGSAAAGQATAESAPEGGAGAAGRVEHGLQSLSLAERQQRKPNRQKARAARKKAANAMAEEEARREAEEMPDQREIERKGMSAACAARGLSEMDIRPDGHCLYSSIADQLDFVALSPQQHDYKSLRHLAAETLEKHRADFEPFVEDECGFEEHVRRVRDTAEWGGQVELLALARALDIRINVLTGDGAVLAIELPEAGIAGERKAIWLAYLRHGFGLGEHYNSLRKAD